GGEPLLRTDLAELIQAARSRGMYTNLITSGVGFFERYAQRLHDAGLDSVQISFQGNGAEGDDTAFRITGTDVHQHKLQAARLARDWNWPLTLNIVLHRHNI